MGDAEVTTEIWLSLMLCRLASVVTSGLAFKVLCFEGLGGGGPLYASGGLGLTYRG